MSRSLKQFESMMRVEDRSSFGEVTTPRELAIEMIEQIPEHILKSSTTTFLDSCFGNGTFIIELIKKLRTYGHSMENIQGRIYGVEISNRLVNKVRRQLAKYNFDNIIQGDSLKKNFMNDKFDVVIGNPPYQDTTEGAVNVPIWHEFVETGLDVLKPGGYLCMIHPSNWRKDMATFRDVSKRMRSLQMEYCKLSNYQTGMKLFGVNTTCDWYVIKNQPSDGTPTEVVDAAGGEHVLDLRNAVAIPDTIPEEYKDIISFDSDAERVSIVYNYKYSGPSKHVSKEKTDEFKYPVLYTLKIDGPTFLWSNTNERGHYGIPKVLMGRGKGKPHLDLIGECASCEWSYFVTADSDEELKNIHKALCTDECLQLLRVLGSGDGHNYLREAVQFLTKDFWKRFI